MQHGERSELPKSQKQKAPALLDALVLFPDRIFLIPRVSGPIVLVPRI